ncbi:MAG: DNA adenine methylase [Ruminococcus sp.]|jgi:hypothetical protein
MAGYTKTEINMAISNEGSRNDVRMRVIEQLAKEAPGTGANELASRFIYYVETLSDGNRVYLRRPANLHYGFDFLVCVEGANYNPGGKRARNYPSHDDFAEDLAKKKAENPAMYKKLYKLLKKVFECHEVTEEEYKQITFKTGLEVDHILKTIKWLFIEQDIRYWNYSGRNMTWTKIPSAE